MRHADAGYEEAIACAREHRAQPADGPQRPGMKIEIGEAIPLATLRAAWLDRVSVELNEDARQRVASAAGTIDAAIAGGGPVYGVNTGCGHLVHVRIGETELRKLQENIVRSHAAGVGEDLGDAVVRLVLLMKVMALARGHSGVRLELVEALGALLEHGIHPRIPAQGSVGASGDLAPLAHLAGVLIGEGEARIGKDCLSATEALRRAGLEPLRLAPKEGLALLNGTQVSTALALAAVFRTENVLAAALVAGAMSTDAIKGSDVPFDPRIHEIRGHRSQIAVAGVLRDLMRGSEIRASHLDCDRVQDPYSIRCQPQVMGACLDNLRHAASLLETEANAVTDNPLVFPDSGEVLSGGNFHAEPVAFAADILALAIAEIGALSERRTALLVDPHLSRLPAFLVHDSGLNSGFMMAGITAAALTSENKGLAHPGERGQHPDLRQPGGPRQHGDPRGPPAPRHAGQPRERRRHRAARGGAGNRVPPPGAEFRGARGGDRRRARDLPALHGGPFPRP